MKFKLKFNLQTKILISVLPIIIIVMLVLSMLSKNLLNVEIEKKMSHQLNEVINDIDVKLTAHSKIAQLLGQTVETYGLDMSKEQYAMLLEKYMASNGDTQLPRFMTVIKNFSVWQPVI